MNSRERIAHQALTDTARLRLLPSDGLEDTQRMSVVDRRLRQQEACVMRCGWTDQDVRDAHACDARACVIDEGHKLLAKLRERRRPATVGQRAPADDSVDNARQAVVDFINQGSGPT